MAGTVITLIIFFSFISLSQENELSHYNYGTRNSVSNVSIPANPLLLHYHYGTRNTTASSATRSIKHQELREAGEVEAREAEEVEAGKAEAGKAGDVGENTKMRTTQNIKYHHYNHQQQQLQPPPPEICQKNPLSSRTRVLPGESKEIGYFGKFIKHVGLCFLAGGDFKGINITLDTYYGTAFAVVPKDILCINETQVWYNLDFIYRSEGKFFIEIFTDFCSLKCKTNLYDYVALIDAPRFTLKAIGESEWIQHASNRYAHTPDLKPKANHTEPTNCMEFTLVSSTTSPPSTVPSPPSTTEANKEGLVIGSSVGVIVIVVVVIILAVVLIKIILPRRRFNHVTLRTQRTENDTQNTTGCKEDAYTSVNSLYVPLEELGVTQRPDGAGVGVQLRMRDDTVTWTGNEQPSNRGYLHESINSLYVAFESNVPASN